MDETPKQGLHSVAMLIAKAHKERSLLYQQLNRVVRQETILRSEKASIEAQLATKNREVEMLIEKLSIRQMRSTP